MTLADDLELRIHQELAAKVDAAFGRYSAERTGESRAAFLLALRAFADLLIEHDFYRE